MNYALANGISETELFEEDNGEPFSTEPTQHNFSELGGMIRINFSKKKIDELGNIGRILYPPKNKATEKNEASSSDDGRSPQQKSETASRGATLAGAAIGAAAGAIIGKVVIGGAIAVIGGLVLGAAAGAAIVGTVISRKD